MGNTYEYNGITDTQTWIFEAGADIAKASARAVKLEAGKAAIPGAGDIPTGIVLISQPDELKAGDEFTVQIKDVGLWKAGGEIAAGDLLATDAQGLCQKAAAGQFLYARALEAATKKGDLIKVQIINAGYAKTE